jgi:hypothetical protein
LKRALTVVGFIAALALITLARAELSGCGLAVPSVILSLFGGSCETVRATAGVQRTDGTVTAPALDAPAPAALTFHGYVCVDTCRGHSAGYEWAEERAITDPDDCPIDPHNSHSFTEGCWAYAGRDGP